MDFKKKEKIGGIIAFFVGLIVYLLTVSPTASFWDCGEFIACANELEVPHPPGAPFFLLIGRIFAIFAPDVETVAYMVNLVSVFSGAFTVMFTFWITTYIGRRALLLNKSEKTLTIGEQIAVLSAGFIAAFACMFADSFWFNTVEAEVYAASSFFTALVVWLMLKWDENADKPDNLKWLLLIAFVMGLSTGVHLLNLLTIPVLAVIYYLRKSSKITTKGILIAVLAGAGILAFIQYGIMQLTFTIGLGFEKFFTGYEDLQTGEKSGLGMPFGTGFAVWLLLLFAGLIFGIYYTATKKKRIYLNTALWGIFLIYIGFSFYSLIMLRSMADPPIDENNPENVVSFLSYMKREQYGDRPLLYGQFYNSPVVDLEKTEPAFYRIKGKDRYVKLGYKLKYKYAPGSLHLFPRMYSSQHYNSEPYGYKKFVKDKGPDPNNPADDNPTGLDNLRFFFVYQVWHMYVRYFFWNFVGRESDEQDSGWESGLEFRKLKLLPESMKKDPSRNHYYFIPLLLGLLGAFWQFKKDKYYGWVILLLFFFTGLAIILYLNQTPSQPRERDYSYAGSIQTFAIWVGIGALALFDYLRQKLNERNAALAATVVGFLAPAIMGAENWDDHSRAGRYVAPDSAYNLLNSCAKNAVLFTNGDNDTFPLWYLQEVEGIRTDVRIVNLSLLNTDWYIYQLKHQKINDADPLPITIPDEQYMGENMAYVRFQEKVINLPVNKEEVIKNKVVRPVDYDRIITPSLPWKVVPRGGKNNGHLLKQDLMIMELMIQNAKQGWKRPIYFAITIPSASYIGLTEYFQLEGMTYRVVPIKVRDNGGFYKQFGQVATDIMYENLMKKFRFRNLDNPDVYYDANIKRMIGNSRNNFYRLASALIEEGRQLQDSAMKYQQLQDLEKAEEFRRKSEEKKKLAKEAMEYCDKKITDEAVPEPSYSLALKANIYVILGEKETAKKILEKAEKRATERLEFKKNYYGKVEQRDFDLYALQLMSGIYQRDLGDKEKAQQLYLQYVCYIDPAQCQQMQQLLNQQNQLKNDIQNLNKLQQQVQDTTKK